jgi:hypothetical protein
MFARAEIADASASETFACRRSDGNLKNSTRKLAT